MTLARRDVITVAVVMAGIASVTAIVLARGLRFADVDGYHADALAFWSAHRLPPEYPILALLPFSLTVIPGVDYAWAFSLGMAAVFLAGWIGIARLAGRRAGVAYAVYVLVGGFGVFLARYDLVPALVTVAAIAAAERRRWTAAYVLLALGVLLKLYPAVLLPLFVIQQWRTDRSASPKLAWFAVTVAAGLVISAALAGPRWLDPYRFALDRPVQVESVPGTVLWVASLLGHPAYFDHTFNSFNLTGSLAKPVTVVFSAIFVVGGLFILYRHAREELAPRRAALALVCLLLVTTKVFSPQYVLWVVPLVAMELGLDPIWVLICVLTTLIYPALYFLTGLVDQPPELTTHEYSVPFLAAIATRNVLLVAATASLLRYRPPAASRPADAAPRAPGA